MVMTQNQLRNIVGILGNVVSFGLFLSPVSTFTQIIKQKAVEQYSPIPYLAMLLNCMLWVFYALPIVHPNSLLIITINGSGFVFESLYLSIFFTYATRKGRMKVLKVLAGELLFMAIVILVVLLTAHTHEKRSLIVGILCIIFCTCMYAAPLSVVKMVIQTKSVKYMPLPLSLASFLNGVCWTTYAFLPFDIYLVVPNGLGSLLALAQLIIYVCYFRATPKEVSKAELELPRASSNV